MIAGSDYTIQHYLMVFHSTKNVMHRDYNTWTHLSREQVVELVDEDLNKPNCKCARTFIEHVVDLIVAGKTV